MPCAIIKRTDILYNAAVHDILYDILIPTYNTVYTVVRKIRDSIIIYS